MFAPKLYKTYKFKFRFLQQYSFNVRLSEDELVQFEIKQADNLLFHQIRRITGDADDCGTYVCFVDCKGCAADIDGITEIVTSGICINGRRFVIGERSASMTRN